MSVSRHHEAEVWAKWQRWFDESLNTIYALHLDRTMYKKLRAAIIEVAPGSPSLWVEHYDRSYLAKQAMAVRRIMDADRKAKSLRRLFKAMEKSPHVFSRARFLAATQHPEDWAHQERAERFEEVRAVDGEWVDPSRITAIRERLERDTQLLLEYANRVIAHPDQRGATSITWADVDQTIDDVARGLRAFGDLFRDAHFETEVAINSDWKGTFRQPLFPPFPERRWPLYT